VATSLRIVTSKPIAIDSPDHIQPWGTSRDNSTNQVFNRKLFWWMTKRPLRVLDLGCSGGGFVKSIHDAGGFGVGVEGSDYSRTRGRAEWGTIPDFLFTADITHPFDLFEVDDQGVDNLARFDVITAWEVIEHIRDDQLDAVFDNILRHLARSGVVIMSINSNEEVIEGVKLHQTVQGRPWWVARFGRAGFVTHDSVVRFFGNDWVRGGPWERGSFHIVATRRGEKLPEAERLRVITPLVAVFDVAKATLSAARNLLGPYIPQALRSVYRGLRNCYARPQ